MNLLLLGVLSFFALQSILWFIRWVLHRARYHAPVDING